MKDTPDSSRGLTVALRASLGHALWLSPSDDATVEWALFLAAELDAAVDGRQIATLGKLYESSLNALGLNPEARNAKTEVVRDEVTPLAIIKSIGQSETAAVDSGKGRKPAARKAAGGSGRSGRDASTSVAKKRAKRSSKG